MPFATTKDNVRLHYEEAGSGTPMLFAHEFSGDNRAGIERTLHRISCIREASEYMSDFEKVAAIDEIPAGGRKSIIVDDRPALLVRIENGYYAFEDVCTHDGGPLGEGEVVGDTVECPRHGARFDVRTGRVRALPAVVPIKTYPLEVEGDDVRVKVN